MSAHRTIVTESVTHAAESGGTPLTIEGTRCDQCQVVRWPRQHYGCENCGGETSQLVDIELVARGRLRTFATVYSHTELETPFTVVDVVLDDGPVVRAVGDEPSDGRSGGRVVATRLGVAGRPHFEGDDS